MFLSPGSRAKPRRRTINGQTGSVVILGEPGGRVTLTSATPVLTTTVSGATTVYYTPYKHNWILIYDGTNFIPTTCSELSQATADTAHSPAAVAASKNYDKFVWNDSGTIRATRGPAWSSDTTRGTGAGTTELIQVNGVWLNKVSITNGPGAQRGTYVATIRSNASSQIDWIFGTSAVGGGASTLGVWNAYNRVMVRSYVQDSNSSWTWSSATPAAADGSSTFRHSFVSGLAVDSIWAGYTAPVQAASVAGAAAYHGFALDATNAIDRLLGAYGIAASAIINYGAVCGTYLPQLGFHFIQATVQGDGTHTGQAYGNSAAFGLEFQFKM